MPPFSGVDLPVHYWNDRERGSSLGSDLTRILGGGLMGLGAVAREEARRREERRIAESRFSRELGQRRAFHADSLASEDARLALEAARLNKDDDLVDFDPKTGAFSEAADGAAPFAMPDVAALRAKYRGMVAGGETVGAESRLAKPG